ncbi:MAG: hypothetical protein FJY73_02410 [Candidatus Eisenbacteria bacterium]|nr:hypothetical protein [Candidatus Eisenbacteria bacterium]
MGRARFPALLLVLFAPVAFAGTPMDVDDVLDLLEAGVSERVILAQIEESGSDFGLTTSEIVRLEEMGVSERILEAMIRSGSGYGSLETEEGYEEEGAVAAVVPSHLGFLRYSHPRYVQVRMVPWSVPSMAYVYVDSDPWFWDPWWWDSYFYVSYRYYPWYRPGWHFAWAWHSPYSWGYWHDRYWWCGHRGHHYWDYRHTYSTAAARESYWKKKTTVRSAEADAPAYRSARYRGAERAPAASTVSQKKTRGSPHGSEARAPSASTVSPTKKRVRSEAASPQVSAPSSTRSSERIAPSRSHATRGSSPAPSASRSSAPPSSSRSSGSAGAKQPRGR